MTFVIMFPQEPPLLEVGGINAMGKLREVAAAIVGVGIIALVGIVVLHARATTAGTPTAVASPTPYPTSMRIPIEAYKGSNIQITPVDASAQPQGSIVSQSTAENTALVQAIAGPGTTVVASALANVSGLGGTNSNGTTNTTGLYWIVSIDPPGGAHSSSGVPLNFADLFISASTGLFAGAVESGDAALPPFPNETYYPSPTGHEGLNTN